MRRRCRCEIGDDCTKTTLCVVTNREEEMQEEIDGLNEQIERLCDIIETQEDANRLFHEEIKRLRAALERIATRDCPETVQKFARDALWELAVHRSLT